MYNRKLRCPRFGGRIIEKITSVKYVIRKTDAMFPITTSLKVKTKMIETLKRLIDKENYLSKDSNVLPLPVLMRWPN